MSPDDEARLQERLELHLTTHEVLILSGGVSMGKFDLVPKVLQSLGVQQVFHTSRSVRDEPMWFGIGPQGQSVFGLPGNPVSTLMCLCRYVVPAIAEAMGTRRLAPERIALAEPVAVPPPLAYFLPVASSSTGGAVPGRVRGARRARAISWAWPAPTGL